MQEIYIFTWVSLCNSTPSDSLSKEQSWQAQSWRATSHGVSRLRSEPAAWKLHAGRLCGEKMSLEGAPAGWEDAEKFFKTTELVDMFPN